MKTSRNKEIKLEEKKGAFSAWESVAGLKRTCDDDMKTEYSTSDIQKISNTKKRKRNEEEFSTNSKLEDEQKIHYPSEYSHSVANKSEDDGPVNASISEDEEESFTVKKAFDHIISPHSEGFTNIDYEDISDKLGIDKLFELVIKLLQKDADNEDNNNFNHIRKLTSNSEEWMDIDIINEEFYMLCSINLKHAVENDNEEAVEFFVELGADKKAGRRVYKPTNSQKIANILDIDGDMSDVEEELSEKNQSEQEEKSEEENDTEEDLTVNYVLKWIRNEQELDENGEILDHEEYPALDDDAYQEIIEKLDSIELVEVIETLIKEDKEGNYLADIKILLSCSHVEIDSDLLDVALVRAINDNEEGTAIFFIKHGAAGSDTAISEAIKHDSYEILSHLEVEADKKHVRAAAEGSYCSAVTYFLEHDFETSSELILIVAAEKSDEELVKIVCDHARLDQAYEIIECLIDNNGKALVSICIENFGTEDLLTTLRDDDIKGKVYGCVLELARSSLISRGILDEEIDLVLSSFDEKLKLSTTLLSYHVNDFKGNLKLLEWRKKIDSSKGLSDKKRQAANLLGFCLSTARSNLVDSPYHPLERKELEKYPRGAGQPYRRWLRLQAARKNKMTYEGKSIPGSSAAHYGFTANFHDYDVSEDVVALDTTSQPSGNIGTGDLYDNTLLYRRKLCDYISNHFSKESETAIKVGFYHNYPCLMIFINQSERAKNLTQHFGAKLLSALTGWTQIVVSYFVGLVNATAQQHGLDIELVRRSSFGFLTPTISDCGQSFRLSVGIIPIEYANILIDCLKILNETLTILSKENKTLESCKLNTTLPKDCFIYNKSYPDYMGDDKEVKAANILDLIWIVIERGAQGKTGAFSLTRTFVGRDGLTAEVYREINKYKPTSLHEYAEILLNALRWGFSHFQLAKRNNKLALRFNEKIPINFKAVLGKHAVINDHSFFEYIKSILTAVRHEQSLNATRYDLFPSTYALNTLKEDEDETVRAIEISIKQRTITGIYFNLEMLNELLYVRNILTCSGNVEDGFGSDSEVEEEIEEKSHFIYAKKNIVRNGMRSISATLEASLDFLRNKLKNRKPKCYLHGAYYETSKAIKLLNKLKKNQLQVTKNVSEADILLYDINACITEGIPLENIDHQIDHIKIIIIDSTSAITEEQNAWVRKFQRSSQMQILFFVSSGLKNEQIGADKNHYGTSRVVTKDKEILNGIVRFIRASKAANIRSAISHGHRRMNIRFGNVPRNGTIVKLKGHQLAGKESL